MDARHDVMLVTGETVANVARWRSGAREPDALDEIRRGCARVVAVRLGLAYDEIEERPRLQRGAAGGEIPGNRAVSGVGELLCSADRDVRVRDGDAKDEQSARNQRRHEQPHCGGTLGQPARIDR